MDVKGVVKDGAFEIVCEDCNAVAMSDVIVSDNGQPFLRVTCRLCGETEEIVLKSDAWPHLPSKITKKK